MRLKYVLDSISDTYNLKNKNKVVFLNTGDIQSGKFLHSDYSDSKFLPGQAKKSIKNNDILFSEIRPANQRFALVNLRNPEDYVVSTKLMVLRCNNPSYSVEYVYAFLTQPKILAELQTLAESRSGTFPQITFSEIQMLDIPEISLAEQSHIVDILGSIDDKIENNEKIISLLEQKMLLEYDEFIMKHEAEKVAMQDIFNITIGKTPPRKESHWFTTSPTDIKWLSISDMGKAQVFAFDSNEKITPEGIEKYNVKIAPKNTVLLSFKLTVGKVAITACEMATNEAIAHFNTDNINIIEYLYCYLKRYDFDSLGNTSSIATAVNSKTIKAMDFLLPSQNDLIYFHNNTSTTLIKIKHLLVENNKLNELKQLYLKKFFG